MLRRIPFFSTVVLLLVGVACGRQAGNNGGVTHWACQVDDDCDDGERCDGEFCVEASQTASVAGASMTTGGTGTNGVSGNGNESGVGGSVGDLAGGGSGGVVGGGTGGLSAPVGGAVGLSANGGSGGFDACSTGGEPSNEPAAPLGFGPTDDRSLGIPPEGRVTSIASDRMEIETTDGTSTFFWVGPALDSAFAVDDAVQIVRKRAEVGALSDAYASIVRSERATAVTVDGSPWTGLETEPGSTKTLPLLGPGFPELVYGLISCCLHPPVFSNRFLSCDYSALDATSDGSKAAIADGATGEAGPWSITNLGSGYTEIQEYIWSFRVTLLGPATPRDGGSE